MNWIIVRTDFRKEAYVARQVANLGFDAWVPAQIITTRPHAARKVTAKAMVSIKELPILPRRLFVSAEFGLGRDWPAIRHLDGIECDAQGGLVLIPDSQITAFRAEIDRENTAALALAHKASRKQKQKWRSLHDALVEMIDGAKTQMEIAA